ncbi:MAG: isochorismatase family cysteine hydrolase [Hyphomonadaceae bacterium]
MSLDVRGDLESWTDPSRTALILVDIQKDFASPDGVLGRGGVDMDVVAPAVQAAQRLAAGARAAGVPVIFVGLFTDEASDSPVWGEWRKRKGQSGEGGLCRTGQEGSAFVGPVPEDGEMIVSKLRYSGFFGTSLDARLRAMGVDTLVVCGLTTECCVDCTVRDAFHLDYFVFLPVDACAAYDVETHDAALKNLELNCATLTTSDDLLGAWSAGAARSEASNG